MNACHQRAEEGTTYVNLRTKTLSVMVVALLAIIGATYATAGHIVAGGFASLEQDEARQNLGRTEQALGVEMNRLDSTAADWSTWDDSYQFVRDGKTDFIEANLYDATLVNLRVDMMVFVDNNGDIVHSQAIDADGNGVELDEATTEALSGSVPLFDFTGTQDSQEGIVTTASGPLLVASRPIVTSEGEGPIAGALVMARWVDERLVSELRGVTKLDIILTPASSGTAEDLAPNEQRIENIDSETLLATTIIPDVSGAPALTAQVTMPRTISAEGHGTLSYLLVALLAIGILFMALLIGVLELTVLRPVGLLSRFVASVGTRLNSRAPGTGSDEIGHLGRSINGMLDTIEQYSTALSGANTQLTLEQQRVEELNHSLEARSRSAQPNSRWPTRS